LIAVKHFNTGVCPSWIKSTGSCWILLYKRVMWFVVRFVEWKSSIGLKEMMHLSTIRVGVHLAS